MDNETVQLELATRLTPELLSQAWQHLWNLQETPNLPTPSSLAHLTEPEWVICSQSLGMLLEMREGMPLH